MPFFFKQTVGMYIMPNRQTHITFYFVSRQCRERKHFGREIKTIRGAHTTTYVYVLWGTQ